MKTKEKENKKQKTEQAKIVALLITFRFVAFLLQTPRYCASSKIQQMKMLAPRNDEARKVKTAKKCLLRELAR